MALPYDPHSLEARWRARWEAQPVGEVDLDAVQADSKFYNLVEFPYPSAEGLHIGHIFRYCGVDAYGRYQRMRGRDVFQPIGFDAFGIHTENYALNAGRHPADLTGVTTERFRAQLNRAGIAWDWRYSVDTSKPQYYRFTQWVFAQLFRAGLAYQADAPVVWCPSCLTVLAREQLEGDRCERCSTLVTERVMRQWFLRITAYADRLLDGLDRLDWPDRAKRLQRNWIGRSEGREIDFGDLTVFTTRPETLPGVTFLAVPPGHPAAGSHRPHPLTNRPLPVVEADYVIEGYGTGVVMGVPAHDERDGRYAAEHGLPVDHAPMLEDVSVVGRPAVRYRLHDWLISRQRYWGPPIPIVHCDGCGPVAVPDSELPVVLPYVEQFRPTGSGKSPLAEVAEFVRAACPSCGGSGRRETDVSDTFLDSAWYFLRYPSADFPDVPWDPGRTERVLPVDFYAGGPEHVQRHHLYARFVTMALHDLGLVPFDEPFPRVRLGGMIVHGGAKMSKSRGNVISPDGYVEERGVDVLRCGLLFTAPWETGGDFHDDALAGIERWFARLWRLVSANAATACWENGGGDGAVAPEVQHAVTRVEQAVERFRFNVAIAALMELTTALEQHVARVSPEATMESLRALVLLLAPFAPHLAEELWERLGEPYSVHVAEWPDVGAPVVRTHELIVQVDGKKRGQVTVDAEVGDAEVEALAVRLPNVVAAIDGRAVARVVVVPGRVVNIVTEDVA